MTSPRVTVAVCTCNRAHLVGRAIASVVAQTFGAIEIVVVDDGSTDDTPAVLAALDDPRLRVIRHAGNRGISRARNSAITAATGEWVAFLDDDNEWAPEYLERQLAVAATHPTADVVYCRARRLDRRTGREMLVPFRLARGRVFHDLVSGWIPLMSAALIRRAALVELGGLDETLAASEDRDLWLRLGARGDVAASSDVLVTRHEHAGAQLSRDRSKLRGDADRLDAKWRRAIVAACGRRAYWRWRAMLVSLAEMAGVSRAVEQGDWRAAIAGLGRLSRYLPWSLPALGRAVVMVLFGPRAFGRLGIAWSAVRAFVAGTARARPYVD